MAETKTILASSYTGSSNFTLSNIANAYTNTSSTTYAQLTLSKKNGTSAIYFTGFDVSSIPSNATITSVSAKMRNMVSSTSYITAFTFQAYNGTTAMGSAATARSTSATTYTLGNAGTWTRAMLDNFRLYVTGKKSNVNNTAYTRIYGIELVVTYEVPNEQLYIKDGGAWKTVTSVYKKANGVWVEQTSLQGVFDTEKNYVKG